MARQMRIPDPPQRQVEDRLDRIVQALEEMADRNIILLSGGVSLGTYDLVPQALVRYGAEIVFRGVKQKPAKPLLLARKGRQLLFGLPAIPWPAIWGFTVTWRRPLGRRAAGAPAPRFQGELLQTIEPKEGRTHFVPARAEYAPGSCTGWRIALRPGLSSADLCRSCDANCYVELPPRPMRRRGRRGSRLHLVCRGVLG